MAGTRGRPKIQSVKGRRWFRESIKQVEDKELDWDHLLWTGEDISRYSAPKVTSQFGGVKNVRRVLWGEAFGELPPIGEEVVPTCQYDNCVSPRHAELVTQSEAAIARTSGARARRASKELPWLYAGCNGSKWEHFTDPYGQTAAVLAFDFAQSVADGVIGPLRTRIQSHPSRVRATAQNCWEDEMFANAVLWCLTSYWIKNKLQDITLTVLRDSEVDTITLLDEDDGDEWVIDVPPPQVTAAPIREPGGSGKRRK